MCVLVRVCVLRCAVHVSPGHMDPHGVCEGEAGEAVAAPTCVPPALPVVHDPSEVCTCPSTIAALLKPRPARARTVGRYEPGRSRSDAPCIVVRGCYRRLSTVYSRMKGYPS